MKISLQRETVVASLQNIIGAVEKRQTIPVLGNVLLVASENSLLMAATDTEIELQARIDASIDEPGEITVPGRKLLDICKALPDQSVIRLDLDDQRMRITCGRSRFLLATLPARDFPLSDSSNEGIAIEIPANLLSDAIRRTSFSMAVQDVRFYLNGLLLEVSNQALRAVATDGHRLAFSTSEIEASLEEPIRSIIPRKSVMELGRLIPPGDETITLWVSSLRLRVQLGNVTMTTKLIDGRFPDYNRVVPIDCDKSLVIDKATLTQTLSRASILSNEKYRGIRMKFESDRLMVSTNNPDHEEATDEIEIGYSAEPIEIGFNVSYLLDAFNRIETENVRLLLKDGNSSCLVMPLDSDDVKYVVMPMRL